MVTLTPALGRGAELLLKRHGTRVVVYLTLPKFGYDAEPCWFNGFAPTGGALLTRIAGNIRCKTGVPFAHLSLTDETAQACQAVADAERTPLEEAEAFAAKAKAARQAMDAATRRQGKGSSYSQGVIW